MSDLRIIKLNIAYVGKNVKQRFISDFCHDIQVLRKQSHPTKNGYVLTKEFELAEATATEHWKFCLVLQPDAIFVQQCELFDTKTGKTTTYCVGEPRTKLVLAPYKKARAHYLKTGSFRREYPDWEFNLPEFREFLKREVLKFN